MRRKRSKKRIFRAAAIATALCLILSSCSGSEKVGVNTVSSVKSRNIISMRDENSSSVHYAQSNDSYSESVVSSGFIELRLDRNTNSFAIYDKSASVLWSSLPILEDVSSSADENCDSSLVTLKIAGGTDIYTLNSQDNSFAYGTSSIDVTDTGANFIYNIFANEETATKETYTADDIGFRVVLSVTLADGNMSVSCSYTNITGNKNAYIEDIELLNYFGAYNDMSSENFMFVPDGCGAIIKTSVYDESFESLSFAVYGEDPANPTEVSGSAIIPVFGVKWGSGAFAAVIKGDEDNSDGKISGGDSVATIKAEKAMNLSSYNRVYAEFNITPTAYEDETLYISKTSAIDEIDIIYRFLSGNNASYAGMASAVREQLIRDSVLSAETIDDSDYLPFYVTLTGVTTKSFAKLKYTKVLTDFDEANDLLIRMKNKGINNINLVYKSIFTGGSDSVDIADSKILSKLGGSSKLDELYEYMVSQNMNLYIDINAISSAKSFSDGSSENIYGKNINYTPEDSIAEAAGTTPKSRSLRKISNFKDVISQILSDMRSKNFSGFCLDDVGTTLYSDFSENRVLRQEASEIISSKISPLATSKKIMVNGGNFYMLKNVDAVINLPSTTSVAKSGAYIPVPFVQIILHGIADYTSEGINTVTDSENLLKHIEYGICPHYEWNYEPIEGTGENDIYYYENTINSAADFYSEINSVLSDLRSAKITDHYEVDDGVFCTEYDNGALIYVNYTSTNYSVLSGVDVEAGSYLRLS